MDKKELAELVAAIDKAAEQIAEKKAKLTAEQVQMLDAAQRNPALRAAQRDTVGRLLAEADRSKLLPDSKVEQAPVTERTPEAPPAPPPAPVMPQHTPEKLAELIKSLRVGQVVWYRQGGEVLRGPVNKITPKMVCIEIDGIKDPMVHKALIVEVEEA